MSERASVRGVAQVRDVGGIGPLISSGRYEPVEHEFQLQLCKTLELESVLNLTVDYGATHLPAHACTLRLVDGRYLSIGAAVGILNATGRSHRVLVDGLVQPVIDEREVLHIPDLSSLSTGRPFGVTPVDPDEFRAYLGVPIVAEDDCIGILSFYRTPPHFWTRDEVDRAQEIADHAAQCIRNAQQYQQAFRKAERLEILQNIVKTLNSAETPGEMFQVIAAQASQVVLNDRISIALYDANQTQFSLAVVAITKGSTELTSGSSLAERETEMASVIRTRKPHLIDDMGVSTKAASVQLYSEGIRSMASVPILCGNECMGCLNVGSREPAAFSPLHVETLGMIADHLAIAVRNAQLYHAVRESQEYTSQLVQANPDAIVAADQQHCLRELNSAAEHMFSKSREEAVGKRLLELFPAESQCELEQLLEQVLNGETLPAHETYLLDADSVPVPMRLVLAPHFDATGRVVGSMGILRDLSKERSLEERLSYSERLRMLGELASGVAHNLNNSLFPITTYAQDLLERAEEEEDQDLLELIIRAAWNCASTVKRIQSFAATHMDTEFYRVDMSGIVRDALDFTRTRWRSEAQARGINIQVTVDYQSVPPINGSEGELKEVLANLIFNSIDAMRTTGGQLHIGLSDDGDFVYLMIRDTGMGMTEEVRQSAFDPFYTTKGAEGTGLGLRTAYNIIARHHGTIEILDTSPGKGTTFQVSLPVDLDANEPEQVELIHSTPMHILVVDDNLEICELIAANLETHGHRVSRAVNGSEALKLFQDTKPGIVFTDLSMPDMSGWELAREVKQVSPNVGVALITGWGAQRLDQHDIEESRIDLVLGKPLRDYQIINAVARLRKQ